MAAMIVGAVIGAAIGGASFLPLLIGGALGFAPVGSGRCSDIEGV
jgi:hypothetical protein